jgi:hypothetical protein
VPADVYETVIVPLVGMRKSILIMISTPLDSYNYFSKLLDLRSKRTGRLLFLIARLELVCPRCKALDREHLCKHRNYLLPPWKSEEKDEITSQMLAHRPDTIARETRGSIKDAAGAVIGASALLSWADPTKNPRFVPAVMEHCDFVLVAIDPSGSDGESCSEMAIASIAISQYGSTVRSFVVVVVVVPGRRTSGTGGASSAQRHARSSGAGRPSGTGARGPV